MPPLPKRPGALLQVEQARQSQAIAALFIPRACRWELSSLAAMAGS